MLLVLLQGCPDVSPIEDGRRFGSVVTLQDWFTSCYLLQGSEEVVLFDSCWREGRLEDALAAHDLTPQQVTHVLLTHGHSDHLGGFSLLSEAQLLAQLGESDNVQDNSRGSARIDQVLSDGQVLLLAGQEIHVLAVPGHSPGSAVFWVDGALILGDAGLVTGDGAISTVPEGRSDDPEAAEQMLRGLAARLEERNLAVDWVVPAHSGALPGLAGLRDFARQ